MTTSHASASLDVAPLAAVRVRQAAFATLALTLAAVQFSVAIAQIFLTVALLSWAALLAIERRRPSAPAWALPLLLYAGWTLVSVAFSISPIDSLLRAKQLVLLLLVPLTYDLVEEDSAVPLTTIILAAGAASAIVGVGQYAILHYDDFGRRPIGTVGFAMTFTGLIMLTLGLATARVLFMTEGRMWPSLMLPALAAALAVSFLRNAWVGACIGVAVLLVMR
ncbi:MAG TPA: hypothetical protein VJK49_05770, partial [Candidatus Limnocylindrales bacterium]|nr:hypothetical protein [Candidatus Limnocylindrales bacterium]